RLSDGHAPACPRHVDRNVVRVPLSCVALPVVSRKLSGAAALLAVVAGAALPAASSASMILGDREASAPTIEAQGRGIALVEYTTKAGLHRHVLLRGAVNAVANPTVGSRQEAFRVDYSGGWKSQHNPDYWRTFRDACAPYDGPALPFFVAGCKAPDGSYWALQSWQRNLPMRGFDPWTAQQTAVELHVSHWSGALPTLEVYQHYTYGNKLQGFFGPL